MTRPSWLANALVAISVITVVSGFGQVVAPGMVLHLVGADATATSRHFFGIVGMFMMLFGGALWQALRSTEPQRVVVLWAGLQKLGASFAVGLGVLRGIFSMLALGVAGFDLLSGILVLWHWSAMGPATRASRS